MSWLCELTFYSGHYIGRDTCVEACLGCEWTHVNCIKHRHCYTYNVCSGQLNTLFTFSFFFLFRDPVMVERVAVQRRVVPMHILLDRMACPFRGHQLHPDLHPVVLTYVLPLDQVGLHESERGRRYARDSPPYNDSYMRVTTSSPTKFSP